MNSEAIDMKVGIVDDLGQDGESKDKCFVFLSFNTVFRSSRCCYTLGSVVTKIRQRCPG